MNAVREKYRKLFEARADTRRKYLTWKAKVPDDFIAGVIVSYDPTFMGSDESGSIPLIRIRTDAVVSNGKELGNGVFSVFCSQSQLKDKVEGLEHTPMVGDEIQIRYIEDVPMKNGKSWKAFEVIHDYTRHDAAGRSYQGGKPAEAAPEAFPENIDGEDNPFERPLSEQPDLQ